MPDAPQMPTHLDLLNPLLAAMHSLGGSGTTEEINGTVAENLDLPEGLLNQPHNPERSSRTEVEYRLAWARNYLKHYGILENSARGVWALRSEAHDVTTLDPEDVRRTVYAIMTERRASRTTQTTETPSEDGGQPDEEDSWRARLHRILSEELSPDAFERLAKRLLRESGFVQVEVTGRSRDGGIDGKGIMKLGPLLSFHVVFQCKRYQGSVGAREIRDFRGAMIGRADKGLLITTGTFTRDAIAEATRDGAPPIDLVDGEALADILKRFGLGVRTEMVETVDVIDHWFATV